MRKSGEIQVKGQLETMERELQTGVCWRQHRTQLSCALERREPQAMRGEWETVLLSSQVGKAANEGTFHPPVKQETRGRDCQVVELRK